MAKMCGYCVYMDTCDIKEGKNWCEKTDQYLFADSTDAENCRRYCERWRMDMHKGDEAIAAAKRYKEASTPYTPVGCYITTAVVNILGLKDDCPLLQTLRFLRGYYLQEDPQYRDLLETYDVYGPAIAEAIVHDEQAHKMAERLYVYLAKAQKLAARGHIESAIALYEDMTRGLIEKYVITAPTIGEVADQNYDQKSGGHGAFTMKKRS